jgi:PBP1b-binding outer membrane lipoprotein LpoB
MNFKIRMITVTAVALIASGCATVDMTEMASPVAVKTEVPAEKNIVLRAASKLYAAFRSKGFAAKTSRKRMQSAASILLNGLEERELTTETNYEAQGFPRDVVIADIAYAGEHVRRVANAAEVYFEMSEGKKKLRDELGSLEQALVSSREAAATFESIVGDNSVEIRNLNTEIDRLKSITDEFGKRVREGAAAEMAARRKETS